MNANESWARDCFAWRLLQLSFSQKKNKKIRYHNTGHGGSSPFLCPVAWFSPSTDHENPTLPHTERPCRKSSNINIHHQQQQQQQQQQKQQQQQQINNNNNNDNNDIENANANANANDNTNHNTNDNTNDNNNNDNNNNRKQ